MTTRIKFISLLICIFLIAIIAATGCQPAERPVPQREMDEAPMSKEEVDEGDPDIPWIREEDENHVPKTPNQTGMVMPWDPTGLM